MPKETGGGMNRRDFIRNTSTIVGGLVAGSLPFLTGCEDPNNKENLEKQKQFELPEISGEELSREEIDIWFDNLAEKEKKELEVCLTQYYKIYNLFSKNCSKINNEIDFDIPINTNMDEKTLKYRLLGMYAVYWKDFEYEQAEKEKARAVFREGKIVYNLDPKKVKFKQNMITEYSLFSPDSNMRGSANFIVHIAELSHSVEITIDKDRNNRENLILQIEKAKVMADDFLVKNPNYENPRTDVFESAEEYLIDFYKYNHIEFKEYATHRVTEKAILLYSLGIFPDLKFKELYDIFKQVHAKMLRNTFTQDGVIKAKVLARILQPTPLKYIIDNIGFDIDVVLKNLPVFMNLNCFSDLNEKVRAGIMIQCIEKDIHSFIDINTLNSDAQEAIQAIDDNNKEFIDVYKENLAESPTFKVIFLAHCNKNINGDRYKAAYGLTDATNNTTKESTENKYDGFGEE